MIFSLALAGPPSIGVHDGTHVRAMTTPAGAVLWEWEETHEVPAPDKKCGADVAFGDGQLEITWVCGARHDTFGTVTHAVFQLDGTESSRTSGGPEWVAQHLVSQSYTDALGTLARFSAPLQYSASADDRETVLCAAIDKLLEASTTDRESGHPGRAAARVFDFLHRMPIWEPERPWDFGSRLRVGAPAGSRPAPERTGWLTNTPANHTRVLGLANTLSVGGRHEAARQLLVGLTKLAPDHRLAWIALGDAAYAVSRTADAESAYARARELGAVPPRVDQRFPPG